MLHRFAVGGLGIALVLLVRFIGNERNGLARNLAVGALAVYIMQALVGALFVWTQAAPEWGAMHVGLAAALWSLLVALCAVETLDQQPAEINRQWKPSSETVLN
jgi:heme A synthase